MLQTILVFSPALGALVAGLFATRRVLDVAPSVTLRETSG